MSKPGQKTAMISSTSIDLPEHRREVIGACLREGVFPIGMEHLPARDADAIHVSLEMVDKADIYIGIFAWRYGHKPVGHDISITEMEFNRAVERKIPILVFISHKTHPLTFEMVEADKDAQKKLGELKGRASDGRGRREFRSPEELRAEVIHALSDLKHREHTPTLVPTEDGFGPFMCVRNLAGVFGMDADPAAFSPSLREFEEKLVHRPALADQIEAALLRGRSACMLGKGASGKTTLALLLAFSETFGPEQSYYFDLAETDDEPDATESYRAAMQAIARQHGRDALVIVDNIHLAEGLTHKLYLAWREAGQPVRLLLQGRFTQQGADRRGRQSPLEELKRTAHVLEVKREDLVGVLQRLVRRSNRNHSIANIPPAILDQWLEVFGGELVAFSSAARRKLPQIVRGQYALNEADAADHIREEYLENQDSKRRISTSERENLLAIAACAGWELPVPVEALPHPSGSTLAVSMKRGLVWQSSHGRYGQFECYRLCHPGMGRLLWVAAKMAETNRLDQVCALAERYPHFGCLLANRLARVQGDQEAAKLVLVSAVSRTDAFERLIEHGMVALHIQCRQLTGLGAMSESEVDQKLVACKNLVESVLATPLHCLANFLKYAQTPLPQVWQVLWDALLGKPGEPDQEAKLAEFVKAARATSLENVGSFLGVAKEHERDTAPLWDALLGKPGEPDQEAKLAEFVKAARATSLEKVGSFLRVAKEHERDTEPLWDALLGKPGEPDQEAKLAEFVKAAWTTSLNNVGSFLGVAKEHGYDTAPLWNILANAPDRLSQKGTTQTLEALVGFAHYAPISLLEIAVREIRPGHWNSTLTSKGLVGATWLAWRCTNVKRDDLATDLMTLLLRRANWRDFPSQSGGYAQLCWLLANVPSSAAELVEPFLKAVRTDKWLQIAYAATSCAQLASGLRQLVFHQSVERCRQFHHKGLGGRLNKELERFETATPTEQSQIIQFLGCAGLCGCVSQRSLASISHGSVSQLPISILPHRTEAAEVEDHQMQLWLGLRAYVSITRQRLPLPPATIEETLKLWRANLGETTSTPATVAHRVNQSMVAWLETCSRTNPSTLVPSAEPLWVLAGFPL